MYGMIFGSVTQARIHHLMLLLLILPLYTNCYSKSMSMPSWCCIGSGHSFRIPGEGFLRPCNDTNFKDYKSIRLIESSNQSYVIYRGQMSTRPSLKPPSYVGMKVRVSCNNSETINDDIFWSSVSCGEGEAVEISCSGDGSWCCCFLSTYEKIQDQANNPYHGCVSLNTVISSDANWDTYLVRAMYTDGTDGKEGPQGLPGMNGTDGEEGPRGLPGLNGTNGSLNNVLMYSAIGGAAGAFVTIISGTTIYFICKCVRHSHNKNNELGETLMGNVY